MENFNLKNKKLNFDKISNITSQLKKNLSKKFNNNNNHNFLQNEIYKNSVTNNVSTLSAITEFVDPIIQFFQNGIYEGNLNINGELLSNNFPKKNLIKKNNQNNNTITNIDEIFMDLLSKKNIIQDNILIKGGLIKNTSISNLYVEGPLIGIEEQLFSDYTEMYSIKTGRKDFDIFVSNAYNSVNISYLNKNNYYYETSFGKTNTVFLNGDVPTSKSWSRMSILDNIELNKLGEVRRIGTEWIREYPNNFIRSHVTHVLYKPKKWL